MERRKERSPEEPSQLNIRILSYFIFFHPKDAYNDDKTAGIVNKAGIELQKLPAKLYMDTNYEGTKRQGK
jgi:hypothetical protein